MKSLLCLLAPAVVACTAADARATPDPDEFDRSSSAATPAPAPAQPPRPRTWDFGVRATSGAAWLTKVNQSPTIEAAPHAAKKAPPAHRSAAR